MTTLEKIRAEIAKIEPLDYPCDKREPEHIRDMALDIIDKYAEQEPCDDVVSRQAVLDEIDDTNRRGGFGDSRLSYTRCRGHIEQLPTVRPQEQTGHWIYTEYHTWCCSECGGNPHKGTGFVPNKDGMKMRWKYCNLCGAKMESEGK